MRVPEVCRFRVRVEGVVQGVGFRPFIYGLALSHRLGGYVSNTAQGVELEVEGPGEEVARFIEEISLRAPPLAVVRAVASQEVPVLGERAMVIRASTAGEARRALIPPDVATCRECREDILDPANRRSRYPFTNCTNCGPRFTIVDDIPYDRPQTSMASFILCPLCQAEYHDPANRRFHAQPNACPDCGPHLELWDDHGCPLAVEDPLGEVAALLHRGEIVAIKGLGGFHLAVDGANEGAVRCLRERKGRDAKPFALMVRDMEVAEGLVGMTPLEKEALASPAAPIVLLPRKSGAAVAEAVAPGCRDLGIMLPYTPLHHLLMERAPAVLVMTSGNLSDEPIAASNEEALSSLAGVAGFFLVHNRDIRARADDSVLAMVGGRTAPLRRSRGYVPLPVELPEDGPCVLALGGALKNTFCLTRGNQAFLSGHMGDLDSDRARELLVEGAKRLQGLLDAEPEAVAVDLHPDYPSTILAAEVWGHLPALAVQHHHAHAISCLVDHGHEGPALALTLDGAGLGPDGTIWGGEILLVGQEGYERVGHLGAVDQPGGDGAAREPWRMALSHLRHAFGGEGLERARALLGQEARMDAVWTMMERRVRCPLTSSVGRLFDAVSSLLGLCHRASFEGQAAMILEGVADPMAVEPYPFGPDEAGVLDPAPLIRAIVEALGEGVSMVAGRFHLSLARGLAMACEALRQAGGPAEVALSGGVMQNRLFVGHLVRELETRGMVALLHRQVPPGDGGLALGQAVVAQRRIKHVSCCAHEA